MLDLVVIGAGGAGVAAARAARARGLSARVLEAQRRIGGRAATDVSLGAPVDLGAHWLHSPALNPLRAEADRLGHRYARAPLAHRFVEGARWLDAAEAAACEAALDAGFAALAAAPPGDSAARALAVAPARWRAAMACAFACKNGVAPAEASAADFAAYAWEGPDLPVVAGYGALLARLAEGLPIACGAAVDTLDLRPADRVIAAGDFGAVEARAAVVTVSAGVLAGGGLRFLPRAPGRIEEAAAALPMSACDKVALRFSGDPFGGLTDALVLPVADADRPVEIALAEGGAPVAVGMVHGAWGRALAAEGPDAMAAWLLDALAALFGESLRRAVLPGRVATRWDAEPFVRGYVAQPRPGDARARDALAAPAHERLAIAGEAVAGRFAGDLHGAWLSGEAAVARLFPGS